MTTREARHHLIDDLPDEALPGAERSLRALGSRCGLPRVLGEAPLDDEPLTDEDRAALAEACDDLRAGRVVSHAEIEREFGA
ncbi:MAG TPA: hypothetical protein VFD32_06315 [Dehalococcoidia bacterium]|nr:hypothetical protein [Dehalococcoidia bacterium]